MKGSISTLEYGQLSVRRFPGLFFFVFFAGLGGANGASSILLARPYSNHRATSNIVCSPCRACAFFTVRPTAPYVYRCPSWSRGGKAFVGFGEWTTAVREGVVALFVFHSCCLRKRILGALLSKRREAPFGVPLSLPVPLSHSCCLSKD